VREHAYGQAVDLKLIDRLGVWLGVRHTLRHAGNLEGKTIGDFGCGYNARFTRPHLDDVKKVVLADVAIAPDLKSHPRVQAVEGLLPESLAKLPAGQLDLVLCISVLEHLWEPELMLMECRRLLVPRGRLLLSVPTWLDKRALEFIAFRLGVSRDEVEDHKRYYTRKDLWTMVRRAGFQPSQIRCRRFKFGLAIFCRATTASA
jgi:2-polyprenyl-3-methyl-5-hydroxy-6-metoxy-1,4-benzoquinol methylase